MHRSVFRVAVLSLMFIVLALLGIGCGRAPEASAPVTTLAPTSVTAVEPTASLSGEQTNVQNTALSVFTTADFSGSGTCSRSQSISAAVFPISS